MFSLQDDVGPTNCVLLFRNEMNLGRIDNRFTILLTDCIGLTKIFHFEVEIAVIYLIQFNKS